MTEEEKEKEKQRIVEALKTMPEEFLVDKVPRNKAIAEIEAGSAIGEDILALIGNTSPSKTISMGKRYLCLNCKSEVLAVKAPATDTGSEKVSCCHQPMWIKEPKPIPSSD